MDTNWAFTWMGYAFHFWDVTFIMDGAVTLNTGTRLETDHKTGTFDFGAPLVPPGKKYHPETERWYKRRHQKKFVHTAANLVLWMDFIPDQKPLSKEDQYLHPLYRVTVWSPEEGEVIFERTCGNPFPSRRKYMIEGKRNEDGENKVYEVML